MRHTRRPCAAIAAARFTAVVVFPTPPFWFISAIVRRFGAASRAVVMREVYDIPRGRRRTDGRDQFPSTAASPAFGCQVAGRRVSGMRMARRLIAVP